MSTNGIGTSVGWFNYVPKNILTTIAIEIYDLGDSPRENDWSSKAGVV
jgi:hypothetical protein